MPGIDARARMGSRLALVLFLSVSPMGRAAAPPVHVRVLSLNLMQKSPVASRRTRMEILARFLGDQADAGRPVDVLLLQEGCSGLWVGTCDSIRALARRLSVDANDGVPYGAVTRPAFGVPLFLVFRVGVVVRGKPLFDDRAGLFCREGDWYVDLPLSHRGRVVAVGVQHPLGRVNVFSTHLCSAGSQGDRQRQVEELLAFIRKVNEQHPAELTVLGGDMNTRPGTDLYRLLAAEFTDSYAAVHPGAAGPTFNLPGNPHCRNYKGNPCRIDFVFVKGDGFQVAGSEVVLSGDGSWVSDHSGVLTELRRQPR